MLSNITSINLSLQTQGAAFVAKQINSANSPVILRQSDGTFTGHATLTSAKTQATSGSCIFVMSGFYDERDLLKDGVDWWFAPNTGVNYTGDAHGGIFDDYLLGANAPIRCTIGGYGEFTMAGTNANTKEVLNIAQELTEIVFHARKITVTSPNIFAFFILASNGRLMVDVDEVVLDTAQLLNITTVVSGFGTQEGYGLYGRIGRVVEVGTPTQNIIACAATAQTYTVKLTGDLMDSDEPTGTIQVQGGNIELTGYTINGAFPLVMSDNAVVKLINCRIPEGEIYTGNNNLKLTSCDLSGSSLFTYGSAQNVGVLGGLVRGTIGDLINLIDLDGGLKYIIARFSQSGTNAPVLQYFKSNIDGLTFVSASRSMAGWFTIRFTPYKSWMPNGVAFLQPRATTIPSPRLTSISGPNKVASDVDFTCYFNNDTGSLADTEGFYFKYEGVNF